MKIVQSFWTRPYVQAKSPIITGLQGGWPSQSIHLCSWALSCLQLRKFYDRVELITDDLGKEILIDQLKLPYTHVSLALNDLEKYDDGIWALGKLYAYGLQQEPFLHMDGDIFIFDRIEESVTGAPFFAQNLDTGYPGYLGSCKTTWDSFTNIPAYFEDIYRTQQADCCNLGITGGSDIDFIQRCVQEAFDFYEGNKEAIIHSCRHINSTLVNIILEQTVMFQYAKYCGREITYLFPGEMNNPRDIGFFPAAANNKGYVHCYGRYKKERLAYSLLQKKLHQEFPWFHKRIIELYGDSSITGHDIRFASMMEKVLKLTDDEFLDLELAITDNQSVFRNEKSINLSEPLTPHTLQALFTTYGLSSFYRRVNNYGKTEEIKLGIMLFYIDLFASPITVCKAVKKMVNFIEMQNEQVLALLYAHFKVTGALQLREAYNQHILYVIKEMILIGMISITEPVGIS